MKDWKYLFVVKFIVKWFLLIYVSKNVMLFYSEIKKGNELNFLELNWFDFLKCRVRYFWYV